MIKFLIRFILFFWIFASYAFSEIVNDVEIRNNDRISKETIITYGKIELDKSYNSNEINEILKNLYETNFFKNIDISVIENKLVINVEENQIIQKVFVEGIKSKSLTKAILDNLYSKDKAPFLLTKLRDDINRTILSLNQNGYYFAKVTSRIEEKNNNTIDLFLEIDLGEKAKISKIEFIGDKKVKDRTLRNIIITEEDKFWKFISKKIYLNEQLIDRDKRLLKNFYLNRGYYDVNVVSTSVNYLDDNSFKVTFKIDAGPQYTINTAKLILPSDYDESNFLDVNAALKKLVNETYSFNDISKVVEEIDKVSLLREYDFINAEVIEKKLDNNFIDIEFKIEESEKFYVERINILGNNITHENVIRNSLEIDEGDPFNELLNAKSINNLRALNIFSAVSFELEDGKEANTKEINIEVEEKPTGEITLGAGFGTEGGTVGFSITENNFLGKNIKLTSSLRTSEESIKGGFNIVNPNWNYSNKSLITSLESSTTDKLADSGYKTNKTGFSLGTRYEQYKNTYFSPSVSVFIEDVTTDSKASASLKKQSGNYFENNFNYQLDFDNRNQRFQTSDGTRTIWGQTIPLYSEEYALSNSIQTDKWIKFGENTITNFSVFARSINSLNDENVRISDRLSLPRSKLKGFKYGSVGPVDNNDYVGGNYAASINFDTTLPMLLPSIQSVDFKYFIDIGNVWSVDYNDAIDDSNKIRSATGITVDWFTPIGPLNFSFAQDITKASTDKTESFQFNLGTTF